ncbi:MgtC/SapB family protein [Candidatus Protochlamydia sp. R18]|uniref:MgtC/SapB family protein n=1 Tax=Candidatus Protochlamydia sp. R18 TaxID=1353977 RepID=UPI0005A88FAE|nr:MgtC/SapB family protein [Candidatus Protochlamydia sp. R18]
MENFAPMLSHGEILLRLMLAATMGGLIGLERERTSWFAGLRTHMLVCMGSSLLMIVSQYGFNDVLRSQLIVLDPSRVAAQVVSGIGFLGTGTILFWKNTIKGLTTAASLWAVAAVGLSIGGGLYLAAISMTVMIFIVLACVKPLENYLFKKKFFKEIRFTMKPTVSISSIEDVLIRMQLRLDLTNFQIESEGEKELVRLYFKSVSNINTLSVLEALKELPGIETIEVIE